MWLQAFFGAIVVAALLAVACGSGPKTVALRVCVRNDAWVRPSEQKMGAVWSDPRYGWRSLEDRREALRLSFYRYTGSPSLDAPVLDLAGLTLPGVNPASSRTGECGTPRQQDTAVFAGNAVELWSMLYDVAEVTAADDGYRVHVTPIESGFRVVQFDWQAGDGGDVRVIGPAGRELDCLGPESTGGRCK